MPNHPHATMARSMAGTFAPRTPKLARHRTGNDNPYLVPACALRIIGTSTIVLPNRIVIMACHHFMPCAMSPDARVYVVMTTLMPIQSAAMLYVDHVRRAGGIGEPGTGNRYFPARFRFPIPHSRFPTKPDPTPLFPNDAIVVNNHISARHSSSRKPRQIPTLER